jgi:hypothetical protein
VIRVVSLTVRGHQYHLSNQTVASPDPEQIQAHNLAPGVPAGRCYDAQLLLMADLRDSIVVKPPQ